MAPLHYTVTATSSDGQRKRITVTAASEVALVKGLEVRGYRNIVIESSASSHHSHDTAPAHVGQPTTDDAKVGLTTKQTALSSTGQAEPVNVSPLSLDDAAAARKRWEDANAEMAARRRTSPANNSTAVTSKWGHADYIVVCAAGAPLLITWLFIDVALHPLFVWLSLWVLTGYCLYRIARSKSVGDRRRLIVPVIGGGFVLSFFFVLFLILVNDYKPVRGGVLIRHIESDNRRSERNQRARERMQTIELEDRYPELFGPGKIPRHCPKE